jgi:glycosyltransferase involved in cell wall biosynthesis
MPEIEKAPLRILFVIDGSINVPSARVRALQYQDLLGRREDVRASFANHKPTWAAKLEDWAHRWRMPNWVQSCLAKISSRLARFRESHLAAMAAKFDIVYVVKVPSLSLFKLLANVKGPMIFMDLNDGLWLPSHRRAGWGNLEQMLELSHGIICENQYVMEFARRFSKESYIVHDPPQVEVFDAWRDRVTRDPGKIVIGWVGSFLTSDALYSIFESLETLFEKHPQLHLRLIGTREDRIPRFEKVRYSILQNYNQETMAREVLAMDIGLFPLFKVEDSLVRGTLKAMVYMSGGAVAVATRVGENMELIQDGKNGMLADGAQEWFDKLDKLIMDPNLRTELGKAGLKTVREHFTREHCLEQLLSAFRSGLSHKTSNRS